MRFLIALSLCLFLPTYVAAKPSPYQADTFLGDKYIARTAWGGMTRSVLDSIPAGHRYKDRHGWRPKRKPHKAAPRRCVEPGGDQVDGVNTRQCKHICRDNPFSGKHECGRWLPSSAHVPLPAARPEMDEDQAAAYRVIAALFAGGKIIIKPLPEKTKNIFRGFAEELLKARGVTLKGVVHPLAVKAAELSTHCGARVISAVRHTYVAGTRRISLHASGRAVDMAGNPSCMYALLKRWPGGYSVDYARVRHIHISYDISGRREWGARFVHRHVGRRTRYARRHHRQHYASAR